MYAAHDCALGISPVTAYSGVRHEYHSNDMDVFSLLLVSTACSIHPSDIVHQCSQHSGVRGRWGLRTPATGEQEFKFVTRPVEEQVYEQHACGPCVRTWSLAVLLAKPERAHSSTSTAACGAASMHSASPTYPAKCTAVSTLRRCCRESSRSFHTPCSHSMSPDAESASCIELGTADVVSGRRNHAFAHAMHAYGSLRCKWI